jgi:hypothetical protein
MSAMSRPLIVHGGAGGTVARLEDLDRAGAQLQVAAQVMASVAVRAARIATDPLVTLTAPLSPSTWVALPPRLAAAIGPPSGAVAVAARLTGLALAARGASHLYLATDLAVDAGIHAVDVSIGRAVGALVAVPAVAAVVAGRAPASVATVDVVALAGLAGPSSSGSCLGCGPGSGPGPGPGGPVGWVLGQLGAHTGAVEHAVDATPGVLDGVLSTNPVLAALAGVATGQPRVPADLPGAAGWLGRLGSAGSWLRENGKISVVGRRPVAAEPPQGLVDVVAGIATLDPQQGAPPGTVRVIAVTGPSSRRAWIVQVPGTQEWSPLTGQNPLDFAGNVHGMAGERTAGRRLVEAAMRTAGVEPGEPVLLAGHSQGGLVAAQLAADPQFRASHHVTHVITAGAPVAMVSVPASVTVLSLEHDEDVVPRLDGAPNPDRLGWLTVSRSTTVPGSAPDPASAHDLSSYTRTASEVDTSRDPGLVRWRSGLGPFLAGPGATATGLEVTGRRAP